MELMKRSTLFSVIGALSLLGLADAWYLAGAALTDTALTCNIAGLNGCNVVAQSPYSHLLGVPLGVYGVVFYSVFLLLAIVALGKPGRKLNLALLALGTAGLLASAWFLYIQFALIKALCVYCLASAGISVLLWICTVVLWRRPKAPLGPVEPPASV
jgi:uncharacterized membrane protein